MPNHRFGGVLMALLVAISGCAATSIGPSKDLRLRRIVLYQNGIGYFERAGMVRSDALRLQFREHEVDDVIKSLVVLEQGVGPSNRRHTPSTVNVLLPEAKAKSGDDKATWLDVVLTPRPASSISVAYAVPMAAWKATYRIILPDSGAEGRVLLQAWALVDNVTDEDWSNVRLTLASGAPLSFASDLRSPRYVPRPDANGRMVDPVATGPVVAENTQGDRDGDGIPDSMDRCPDEASAADDVDGCPDVSRAEHKIVVSGGDAKVLSTISFARGSDALAPATSAVLDEVAAMLKAHREIARVGVAGHASADEKDPEGLSARRAAAVRAALLQRGVTTELVPRAYGATRPIDSGSNDAARARNRRTEFSIDAASGGESYATRLKDLERRTDDIKAQIRRNKTRQALLRDTVLSSGSVEHAAAAAPKDIAGAVRYDIGRPITIPHRSSTLVTLVNDYLPGGDVFLFRPDPNAPGTATHPLRAARIENRGGHGLQSGSVSIFAGGTFAGEGLIDNLAPGETAMIPYALDSSTTVRVSRDNADEPVRLVALSRGTMTVEDAEIITTRYEIAVGRQAPGTMYVRHTRREGFDLKELPPGSEPTADGYLVPVSLQPRKTTMLAIKERRIRRSEIAVLDAGGARLGLYIQNPPRGSDVKGAVREIVQARVELGKLEEVSTTLRQELADSAQRAAELRASLHAIEKTPRAAELQKKLVDQLAQATTHSEELSTKLTEQTNAMSELRAKLADRLRDVRLDDPASPRAP